MMRKVEPDIIIKDDNYKEKLNNPEPTDRYYFVRLLFILLGLLHFLPFTFFVTANAYWMEKFRNVSAEITDTDARTTLQTRFAPGGIIAGALPSAVFMLGSTFYGYKIRARVRVLAALIVFTITFVLMSIFVKINTDSWQLGFFILTMLTQAIIASANAVLEVAALTILSKFPRDYLKMYLLGQGVAGIFNAVLQILTLAIGTSTTTSALIYFIVGSAIMGLTLVLYFFSKYNKCYNWHNNSIEEDTKRDLIPFYKIKSLLKTLWPVIATFTFIMVTLVPTHTAITALVVSENYGNGNAWNDKYFVPTVTFLFSEIMGLSGRMVSSKVNKTIDKYLLTFIMFIRMIALVPLIYFCNAQPRKYSHVLLPHDWQYIIVLGVLNFTTGYFFNMLYLEVGKFKSDQVEDAFMVLMSFEAVIGALVTPISLFAVELL